MENKFVIKSQYLKIIEFLTNKIEETKLLIKDMTPETKYEQYFQGILSAHGNTLDFMKKELKLDNKLLSSLKKGDNIMEFPKLPEVWVKEINGKLYNIDSILSLEVIDEELKITFINGEEIITDIKVKDELEGLKNV